MINFALCDDNVLLLSKLSNLLENIFLKHNLSARVSFVTSNELELLEHISKNTTDVLFLDIDLNSKYTGIDIAKKIRKQNKNLYLIFITGHFEYILSAYECKTFDFIQKPFSQIKLENTILRLFEDLNDNPNKFIKLNHNHSIVNQSLVNFIQKNGMKTIFYLPTGEIESYIAFTQLGDSLPKNFVRCHKSYIVNINNISNIDLKTNTIHFKEPFAPQCFIGPKYKNNFMEVFNNYGNT